MSFQAYIDNIFKKTGKLPADFAKLAEQKGFIVNGEIPKTVKATQITDWLQQQFDLGLGYARAIYATFKGNNGSQKLSKDSSTSKSFVTIQKSILIDAPANEVWKVLFSDQTYRIWASVFSEGSYFKTDWKVGSKVIFTDLEGYGLVGKIVANNPNKKLEIKYTGQLVGGVEDSKTKKVTDQIKDATEKYLLTSNASKTELKVELTVIKDWYNMLNEGWDKAISKIKELAENEQNNDLLVLL